MTDNDSISSISVMSSTELHCLNCFNRIVTEGITEIISLRWWSLYHNGSSSLGNGYNSHQNYLELKHYRSLLMTYENKSDILCLIVEDVQKVMLAQNRGYCISFYT